jgi:hypothetical protein
MASRNGSSSLLSFQPCIQILPTTSLANHGKALQSNTDSSSSSGTDHCFIFDTTGRSNSLLYDMGAQTMTSRTIPYSCRDAGDEEQQQQQQQNQNVILLKSRYIFALNSNDKRAYDLERQAPTSVPWDASTLARSSTGYTVLHHHHHHHHHHGGSGGAGTVGGGVYVLGGRDKTNRCMRSDVQFLADTTISMQQPSLTTCWERKPPMKIPRRDAAAVAIGNLIYVIGGMFWDACQARYRECPYTEIFDGERWTFGPSLNVPREKHCAVVVGNNNIVVLGGKSASSSSPLVEDVEIWNTSTDFFAFLPSGITPARANFDAVVHGEGGREIYLIGGGTRAIGNATIDLAKLTPEELCYLAPAVDAEAPPTSMINGNGDEKKLTTIPRTVKGTSSTSTKINTETKEWLPMAPSLPQPPVTMTLRDRRKAMTGYIASLMAVQEQYRQTVAESKERIAQHYGRTIEQQTKLRDLEIDAVQFHSTSWLKDTERLAHTALADVQLMETQLQSRKVSDTKVTTFLKQNDQDEFYDNIPSQLRCPLTLDLMTDPVVAADGNMYERSALQDWFRNSKLQQAKTNDDRGTPGKKFVPRSPLTGAELPTESFFPVHTLRSMCKQFAKQIDEKMPNETDYKV